MNFNQAVQPSCAIIKADYESIEVSTDIVSLDISLIDQAKAFIKSSTSFPFWVLCPSAYISYTSQSFNTLLPTTIIGKNAKMLF